MLTFADVKADLRMREVVNCCPNSEDFKSLVNSGVRRLLNRGDFEGTVAIVGMCLKSDCVTWPRFVKTVRKLNICNQPVPTANGWYAFLNSPTFRTPRFWGGSSLNFANMDIGPAPTYDQVKGENQKVRLYTFCQNDIGKVTRIYGRDSNGQPLAEKDANGDWIEGVSLVAAIPFVSTSMDVQAIDRVQREKTQCHQKMYAFDTVNSTLRDLADYQTSETNPSYFRTKLAGKCCSNSCNGLASIVAEIKLAFIPVESDNDLVLISNLDAWPPCACPRDTASRGSWSKPRLTSMRPSRNSTTS